MFRNTVGTKKTPCPNSDYRTKRYFGHNGEMDMLGHSSKTVPNAYARKCKKAAPTPEAYMKAPEADVIDGARLVA